MNQIITKTTSHFACPDGFDGCNVDWTELFPQLRNAPRLGACVRRLISY